MPNVEIVETPAHVFEVVTTPGDEVPGRVHRTMCIRLLSGEPITGDQWGHVKEAVVRELIARGCRVYDVTPVFEEGDDP